MKYIALGSINSTNSMPLKSGTLQHIQNSYKELFYEVCKSLIGNDYDNTKFYVLSGCVNSGSGSSYVISEGAILYANTIYLVPATTFTTSGGQVAVVDYLVSNVMGTNYDPVLFTNGTSINVHYDQKMQVIAGNTGTTIVDFDNLVRVNQHNHIDLTLATGYKVGTGTGVHVTRNQVQQVTIEGVIQVDGGSVNMITAKIGTLPLEFRPLHALSIPCSSYDNPQIDPAILSISTNGDIYVISTNFSTYPTWKNNTVLYFNCTYYIH